jgi:hypothetical protein
LKEDCSLQDIRWWTLLQGNWPQTYTNEELQRRIQEASALLQHIFNKTYEECLAILVNKKEIATYLIENLALFKNAIKAPKPTIV